MKHMIVHFKFILLSLINSIATALFFAIVDWRTSEKFIVTYRDGEFKGGTHVPWVNFADYISDTHNLDMMLQTGVVVFVLIYISVLSIWYNLMYPHIGWKRLSILVGVVSSTISFFYVFNNDYELYISAPIVILVFFSSTLIILLVRDLYGWVKAGFQNPTGITNHQACSSKRYKEGEINDVKLNMYILKTLYGIFGVLTILLGGSIISEKMVVTVISSITQAVLLLAIVFIILSARFAIKKIFRKRN